jgi:hypothetical protein
MFTNRNDEVVLSTYLFSLLTWDNIDDKAISKLLLPILEHLKGKLLLQRACKRISCVETCDFYLLSEHVLMICVLLVADSDGGGGGDSGKDVAALTEKKMGRSLPPVNTITYTVRVVHILKLIGPYITFIRGLI